MSSTDYHLRHLIEEAAARRSHRLIDDAFAVINVHFDRFSVDFSPELLVVFAEVASDLRGREPAVARALELFDRLRCEDDQFKVRALLTRCVYEARQGSDAFRLKGPHALQQLKYALDFLMQALAIATRAGNDTRYGFLVYNTSLVFWDVVRPLCRSGWQRHIVTETVAVIEALKVVKPAGGDAKGKGAPGGTAAIPVTKDMSAWLVELSLNLAFGLEDAERNADAQKAVDAALPLAEEAKDPKLKMLVLSAKAYLARKAPGKTKDDIDKASGSSVAGTVFFVCNGGIPKEQAEEALIVCWKTADPEYDLREARDLYATKGAAAAAEKKGPRSNLTPQQLLDLTLLLRAACTAECWAVAQPMHARLETFRVPAGRARLLLDLSTAEVQVWTACNVKLEDPVSKLLLSPEAQAKREVEARQKAVRLCEQCVTTGKRMDEIDLVEESAVVMWNLGKPLAGASMRHCVHKSFQKCADVLEEVQSSSLVQLRVHLHFEVASCEVANDLLTHGRDELRRAKAIDFTVTPGELPETVRNQMGEDDPGPFVRAMDCPVDQQLHLLFWKLNVYEEPSDPADQVMLLLDQVQKQVVSNGKLTLCMLTQGFSKLEAALEDVSGDKLQSLSDTFSPPPRVLSSASALQPLPHQAPATVREGGTRADEVAALVPQPIRDQQPKSEREEGITKAKQIVRLMCKIGLEAHRVNEPDFAIRACTGALEVADVVFGPPPAEVDGAMLLAEAAYAKAQCLGKKLKALNVLGGVDDEKEPPPAEEAAENAAADSDEEEAHELSAEEKIKAVAMKRELISSLLYGVEKSREFKQWWSVANGLHYWWNLHLDAVSACHENPELLTRMLQEYQDGLKTLQMYLCGDTQLPNSEFNHSVASNLLLAHIEISVANGQLGVLEVEQLMVLRRLGEHPRKDIVARVSELCKQKEKPLPDLARLRPERLDAAAPAGGGKKGAAAATPAAGEDKSDLQGGEADVIMATVGISFAKDAAEAMKLVDQAVALLSKWEPRESDEAMLSLWIELWTRLGRQCLRPPVNPSEGAKYALMCGIKGLGTVDAPIPKHASNNRLIWRGACHALCGESFVQLVDPHRQEKDSLVKLRRLAVEQFERSCEYATQTANVTLAVFGVTNLWNVALPLLHASETRQLLIKPLAKATKALATCKYQEDPLFFVGLYQARFDCYNDTQQWEQIHEMLNEAFAAIPSNSHRRLWALRMLALSRQGKNVAVAMGKMKESQAKAQAGIWLVLADASSKQQDQLDAFMKAIEILKNAEQPDTVEVRLQLADWLLRNGFDPAEAHEQLSFAADMLLEVEEESEDEDEVVVDDMYGGLLTGEERSISDFGEHSQSDGKSLTSRHSSKKAGSVSAASQGTRGGKKRSSSHGAKRSSTVSKKSGSSRGGSRGRAKSATSSRSKRSSARSKLSRAKKAEEDEVLSSQLYSHNYEALCRVFATQSRISIGEDVHSALLSAVHFAVRFFASTVDLANLSARKLAAVIAAEKAEAEKKSKSIEGKIGGKKKESDQEEIQLLPCFSMPMHLPDWADHEKFEWFPVECPLKEILSRAEQGDLLDSESCTWAGHAEAFARPPLSFHTLVRLEDDLEEHGYHLWSFPVLALQAQLAQSFEPPLSDAVACLAHLRLARLSAMCRLPAPNEKWKEALAALPGTFSSFDGELEQVRSQRAGRSAADALEPDWTEVQRGGRGVSQRVGATWPCSELYAYEVWAALGRECVLHGELFMASTLVEEAARHAKEHGDRRTLRDLQITRAQLARAEGKSMEVIRSLQDVTAADCDQTADVALLLADAYQITGQATVADEILRGAQKALALSSQTCAAQGPHCRMVRAESAIAAAQHLAEVMRLRAAPVPSREWLNNLIEVCQAHLELGSRAHAAALFRWRIESTVAFATQVMALLEARRVDLSRTPADCGALTLESLEEVAGLVCEDLVASRASRDVLLAGTVPVEGVQGTLVLPSEALSTELEVWSTRCGTLRRVIAATAAEDRDLSFSDGGTVRDPGVAIFSSQPSFGGSRSRKPSQKLDEAAALAHGVEVWLKDADCKLNEAEQQRNVARELTEIESSIALLSNAVTVLELVRPPSAVQAEAADGDLPQEPLACRTDAVVELGRVQLELCMEKWPQGKASKWDPPAADPYETAGMQTAERYSNVLAGLPVSQLAEPPQEGEEEAQDEIVMKADSKAEEVAKATLCDGLTGALASRNFVAAKRALQVLALEAYGLTCPEATFEFLCWLQSVDTCQRAEDAFSELLPETHRERVQMKVLRDMERIWPYPQHVSAYQATVKRLQLESPTFQRLQLDELPPVSDLLLTCVPPLTLVVTMQVHNNFLHVGAVCTPADGDPAQRSAQLRHMVTRTKVRESELFSCIQKLQELCLIMEKEMISAVDVDESLADQHAKILEEAEANIVKPILEDLTSHFWPYGLTVDHPANPKQLLLLPDSFLWALPIERFPSLVNLFASPGDGSLTRDLSLHAAAQRSLCAAQAPRPASSVLLTDAFDEDSLKPSDAPKSETMCAVHKRLVDTKVISNADRSLHGQMLTASPEDIKGMLTDSTMFMALGLGRFFTTMNATHFATQDLRHLKLLALFHRAQNDKTFRRQTKTDSMKSIRQLGLETPYGTCLIAAFRGAACAVMAVGPVPVPIGIKCFETFARGLQGGRPVAKALEDAINQRISDSEHRYVRTLEGGVMPGAPAVDPKKGAAPAAESGEELLPPHLRAAYLSVGLAFAPTEAVDVGKKK